LRVRRYQQQHWNGETKLHPDILDETREGPQHTSEMMILRATLAPRAPASCDVSLR